MIEKTIKSYLISNNLPFNVVNIIEYPNYAKVNTADGSIFTCILATEDEYLIYHGLTRFSKALKVPVYELNLEDKKLLFFEDEDQTEIKVRQKKILEILEEFHQNSSYELTLKKEHLPNFNNLYKVLDNKFSYLEMRIREIETSPIKNDISWIVLAKYNIVLDARVYLYDLQQDLFKAIDKQEVVKYGLVYRQISEMMYSKQRLLPISDVYYAPIAMLYCRYYLGIEGEDLTKKIGKLDLFNQKYFCFMVLYILILNLNLEVILNNYSVSSYLALTRKIKDFMLNYKQYIEK